MSVTFAEPAIASLKPLAKLIDKRRAPYLFYLLNINAELLVLFIGIGVGTAAVVGTLRFVKGWSLKPLIIAGLVPTIILSAYMKWVEPRLDSIIYLAWDCGAVTTGPVTVPILLSVGIGVAANNRDPSRQSSISGFGIVTLASIFPVLAVQVLSLILASSISEEEIG